MAVVSSCIINVVYKIAVAILIFFTDVSTHILWYHKTQKTKQSSDSNNHYYFDQWSCYNIIDFILIITMFLIHNGWLIKWYDHYILGPIPTTNTRIVSIATTIDFFDFFWSKRRILPKIWGKIKKSHLQTKLLNKVTSKLLGW